MDKDRALKILIAHAYCCAPNMECSDCPMFDNDTEVECCEPYSDEELGDAAKLLNNK